MKKILLPVVLAGLCTYAFAQSATVNSYYKYYQRIRVEDGSSRVFDESSSSNVYAGTLHGGENQQWMVMPLYIKAENGVATPSTEYLIACRNSGRVLDINGNNNVYGYGNFHGGNNQKFTLYNRTSNVFEISSPKNPGMVFDKSNSSRSRDPFDHPGSSGNNIYFGTRHGGANQQFKIYSATSFASPYSTIRSIYNYQIPFPASPSSFTSPMLTQTGKTFISETLIPFPLVKNDLNVATQADRTPYYRLVRSQFYRLPTDVDSDITFIPGETIERVLSTKSGMKSSTATTVTTKLNISVTGNNEVAFKISDLLSATVSTSIASAFEMTRQQVNTFEETYEKTLSFTYKFSTSEKIRLVTYQLFDYYELFRADGTLVMTWEVPTEWSARVSHPSDASSGGRVINSGLAAKIVNGQIVTITRKSSSRVSDEATLDTDDIELDFTVFPNPTKGQVTIKYDNKSAIGNHSIIIYNVQGMIVHKEEELIEMTDEKVIDLSQLPAGLYLLRIGTDTKASTKYIYKE